MRPWLSWDVETSGELEEYALQPWRVKSDKAWLTTMASSIRAEGGSLMTSGKVLQEGDDVDGAGTYHTLVRFFTRCRDLKVRIVGWNVTFDCAWAIAYALRYDDETRELMTLIFACEWLDVMRLWRHLDQVPTKAEKGQAISYRLQAANEKFEKAYATYKQAGAELYHDSRPEQRVKLLSYNKDDTEATLLHSERFWHQLTEQQQRCVLIEASTIPYISRANVTGQCVNLDARSALSATLRNAGHHVASQLAPHGVTEVMVRSNARLGTLLYKKWGLPILKVNDPTPTEIKKAEAEKREPVGTPSTDKEVLYELGLDDERVFNLQLWREALNLESKFMGGLKKSTDYNGEGNITYPQAQIFGTYTGRVTYGSKQGRGKSERHVGYALHQMKRDKRFRNCIEPPPGYTLVEFDAAGQEFRWMAIKSGDDTMLSLCLPGEDPHSYMTAAIYGWDYHETIARVEAEEDEAVDGRKLGKVANLSLQYRTSQNKLRVVARVQYGLPMTDEEAKHVHRTYPRTYKFVPHYWSGQIGLAKSQGWIETIAGRRIRIEGDWKDRKVAWAMGSTAINFPVQGTGADQKYLAIRCLRNIINEYDTVIGWDLHDGLYFYVPHNRAPEFIERAKGILDNLPYREAWGFTPSIPLPWDAKQGRSWGDMKGWKPQ